MSEDLVGLCEVHLAPRLEKRPIPSDAPVNVRLELKACEVPVWTLHLQGAQASLQPGAPARAPFGLVAHIEDWRDLVQGYARLSACLTDGRLRVEGDVSRAVAILPRLFTEE